MNRSAHPFLAALLLTAISSAATAQEPAGNLPFTNIYKRPAVSPYTMLNSAANNPFANQNPYQTLIQPQLEQERQQMMILRQNRQLGNLQNQVRSIQRDTSMRQLDRSIRPTGHSSTFMNTSHYFGTGGAGRGAGRP